METRARSLLKATLWQCLGLLSMLLVGVLVTGSVGVGGLMALINSAMGFVVYLLYERIWARVRWGRSLN